MGACKSKSNETKREKPQEDYQTQLHRIEKILQGKGDPQDLKDLDKIMKSLNEQFKDQFTPEDKAKINASLALLGKMEKGFSGDTGPEQPWWSVEKGFLKKAAMEGNYAGAIADLEAALKIKQTLPKNEVEIGYSYVAILMIAVMGKVNYNSVEQYANAGAQLLEKLDKELCIVALQSAAKVAAESGNEQAAQKWLDKSRDLVQGTSYEILQVTNEAKSYSNLKQHQKAIDLLLAVEERAKSMPMIKEADYDQVLAYSGSMAQAMLATGNPMKGFIGCAKEGVKLMDYPIYCFLIANAYLAAYDDGNGIIFMKNGIQIINSKKVGETLKKFYEKKVNEVISNYPSIQGRLPTLSA